MTDSPDEYYDSIDLHVRWASDSDLILRMDPQSDTIAAVKQKIRESRPSTVGKNIRLIHSGRVLEDAHLLKDYRMGRLLRDDHSKAKVPPAAPVYVHCSVSDYVSKSPVENSQPQMTVPSGFDRLRESGFNEEEIRNIRTQFHRMHGSSFDGEPTEQARQLEEQWMDNTGETLPDGTIQGTYKEMMWGLMLGFFLGVLCLFWFRESVFTRRHQMGIVAGMLINVSFGVLHVYY